VSDPLLRARAAELEAARVPYVEALVVSAHAPTSAQPGARAIVLGDGTLEGFVGGACAEPSVRLHALRALETGEPLLLRIAPGDGAAPAREGILTVANPCLSGGVLEIFLEPRLPAARLLVAGATPIARAVLAVGAAAGFVAAPLAEPPGNGAAAQDGHAGSAQGNAAAMPHGHAAFPHGDAEPLADAVAADDAVVVATQGGDEAPLVEAAVQAEAAYVGLVASRARAATVLAATGLDAEGRARVHAPAGLDIHARTPEEIALAILAEIVRERRSHAVVPRAATAVDPVCGMTVAVTGATPRATHDGRTVYFCGPGCAAAYAHA
jgi:xanthine dehydrogenase accessory factor